MNSAQRDEHFRLMLGAAERMVEVLKRGQEGQDMPTRVLAHTIGLCAYIHELADIVKTDWEKQP